MRTLHGCWEGSFSGVRAYASHAASEHVTNAPCLVTQDDSEPVALSMDDIKSATNAHHISQEIESVLNAGPRTAGTLMVSDYLP